MRFFILDIHEIMMSLSLHSYAPIMAWNSWFVFKITILLVINWMVWLSINAMFIRTTFCVPFPLQNLQKVKILLEINCKTMCAANELLVEFHKISWTFRLELTLEQFQLFEMTYSAIAGIHAGIYHQPEKHLENCQAILRLYTIVGIKMTDQNI